MPRISKSRDRGLPRLAARHGLGGADHVYGEQLVIAHLGDLAGAIRAGVEDVAAHRCQHWAGEEPYDAARAAEIAAGVDASCPGNAERKAELERRHADDPRILARLRALTE